MISVRYLLAFVLSALALIAQPAAAAPDKIYSMTVSAPGPTVRVTITNETPTGNSTINSFIIKPPAGMTIGLATPKATRNGVAVSPANVNIQNGWVYVNGIDGLKAGARNPYFLEINLTTSQSTTPPCGESRWTAVVYTGNSFGQETFAQVVPGTGANPVYVPAPGGVNQGVNCFLQFNPGPPAGIVSGSPITPTVAVSAFYGSAPGTPLPWDGKVTFSLTPSTGGTVSPSGEVQGTCVGGPPCTTYSFSTLTITSAAGGSFALTATGTLGSASGSTSVTSAPFTVFQGELDCGQTLALSGTNPNNLPDTAPGWGAGTRGAFNSKGDPCIKVSYSVINNILTNNSFGLLWDTVLQPNATFALSANSKLEDVDASGWPVEKRPQMGWKYDSGNNPIYTDGVFCVAPIAPITYGTIAAGGAAQGVSTINVNASITPTTPFVISVDGERLVIGSVSGSAWTLASGVTQAAHAAGALVISKFPGLPERYGTVGGLTSTTLTLTAPLRDLPPVPFPIQVKKERMLVTAVSGNVLTVSRENGMTPPDAALNDPVMSTPLPLLPPGVPSPYVAGTPAQMCIVTYGSTAAGLNPLNGKAQIMRFMEWYDLGDGWVAFD